MSILFLSDGRQTAGPLQPLEGAARARAAGFPVYTVALGTTGATSLRRLPGRVPRAGRATSAAPDGVDSPRIP